MKGSGGRPLPFLWSVAVLAALLVPTGAARAEPVGCGGVVAGVEWDRQATAGPVVVRGAGLHPDLVSRYGSDLAPTLEEVQAEIGGLAGVELCLVEGVVPVDEAAVGWTDPRPLRVAAFGPEGVVVLSVTFRGLVTPAAILGLTYVAQWQASGGSYPEPFGGAMRQYFRSKAAGELGTDHNVLRFANLVERFDPVDWTAGELDDSLVWHLDTQEGAIGDFVAFATAEAGGRVLGAPREAGLDRLDERWRQALLDEARGGGPTSGWIAGLIAALAVVVLAAVVAVGNWRRRRRRRPHPA